jgi:hypothetical protein
MKYIFGDVHLSCLNPWNHEVGEKIIDWFDTRFSNEKKQNYAIFLGDITERDVNPGDVIDQVFRLFKFCSDHFADTYVVMGNHDLKLYRDNPQFSIKFLNNFGNVHVMEKFEDMTIDGDIVRFMPFMRIEGQTLNDYYSTIDWSKYPEADLTVGHWNIIDVNDFRLRNGVDVKNLPTKHLVLGHIHARIDERYTGSMFPNNISEQGGKYPRCFKIMDKGALTEEKLPEFLVYNEIKYPNPIIKPTDNAVHVYTVIDIKSNTEAKSFYKNNYIRGISATPISQGQSAVSSDVFLFHDNKQALNSFLKEIKYPLSRNAFAILNNVL